MDYSGKIITKNPVEPSQTSAPGVWTLDQATQAVQGNNWPIAYVPNPISKSLRFNSADSAYLNRTPASNGDRQKFTFSFWIKRSSIPSSLVTVLCVNDAGGGAYPCFLFNSNTAYLQLDSTAAGSFYWETTQLFRDVSAWYHIVWAVDTTQASNTNRMKLWVNGTQVTTFSTQQTITQNVTTSVNSTTLHEIGRFVDLNNRYLDGYLTEINMVDGQQLDASSFGMTDPRTGAWIPKKYSGTYGTNGFYLNFSDNSTTAALGTDYSGNSNTWTTNGFSVTAGSGNDSMTDVPTPWIPYNTTGDVGGVVRGNYATLNPLDKNGGSTVDGNLNFTNGAATSYMVGSTMVPTMPVYAEFQPTGWGNGNIEVGLRTSVGATNSFVSDSGGVSYNFRYGTVIYNGSTQGTYTAATGTSSVVMMAYDPSSGKLWFGLNGTWFNSGNPAAGTGQVYTITTPTSAWRVFVQAWDTTNAVCANFGQRPFAYTPPAGFKSLCTTNLPEPTILDGGDYFNAVLYTGNGSTQSIAGVGFQPDLVWAKCRSNSYHHKLVDAVRGATLTLSSSQTAAEQTETNSLTAFNSDGFSLGSISSMNASAETFVAWNWKESATSGFDIVTYTGTGVARTVNHNLGVAPSMIIVKARTAVESWPVYHTSISPTNTLYLNSTNAQFSGTGWWNNTAATSTVFTVGTSGNVNDNGIAYVAYLFAAIAGFSAFGSYVGNGSADGPYIHLGFRPRYWLVKKTSDIDVWAIHDTARDPYNVSARFLQAESSAAESTGAGGAYFDLLSNGVKIRTTSNQVNTSGGTYIYIAFAENPFKYSNAR